MAAQFDGWKALDLRDAWDAQDRTGEFVNVAELASAQIPFDGPRARTPENHQMDYALRTGSLMPHRVPKLTEWDRRTLPINR